MSLIATVAADDANSYQTLVEADAYFDAGLASIKAIWDSFSDSDKEAALIAVTSLIDLSNYSGWKTDVDQALKFPRYDKDGRVYADDSDGTLIIPANIVSACNKGALHYLKNDGISSIGLTQLRGVKSFSMGGASYSGLSPNAAALIGPLAASFIKKYFKRQSSTKSSKEIRYPLPKKWR